LRTKAVLPASEEPKRVVETFVFETRFVSLPYQVGRTRLTITGEAAFRRNATRETHAMGR
jgi:hypothetical protein